MPLAKNNRFSAVVDKSLSISRLYIFFYLEDFSILSCHRPSYRNGTCLQVEWSLPFTEMSPTSLWKAGSIPIEMLISCLRFYPFEPVFWLNRTSFAFSFANCHCPVFLLFVNIFICVTAQRYFWPIPADKIEKNPDLKQNADG